MPSKYIPHQQPDPPITSIILSGLSQYHPLSEGLRAAFTDKIFDVQLKKEEHLVKQGEYSHYLYFLMKGVVTGYRIKDSKRLVTFISVDGDFISAIGGMYGITPADESMVAAEDCYLVGIRSADLLDFFDTFPEMNIIMRKILENYYKAAHERAIISRMGTAKEKYLYYLQTLPSHEDKVSIELVANFLDIKTATLSRIKNSIKTDNAAVTSTEVINILMQAMRKDQLFQRKGLSLQHIATHLNISPHQLSYLLNDRYQQSFSDFVNSYRVDYIKNKLTRKSNFKQTTIEALGDEAGFSSKSTFFSAFKKHTGLSPLAYAKELLVTLKS